MTLVSDMSCCVTGVWHETDAYKESNDGQHIGPSSTRAPGTNTAEVEGQVLFEVELPRDLLRLCLGSIEPRWRPESNPPGVIRHQNSSGTKEAQAKDEAILAFSDDGSLHQFIVLSNTAWRLLRFIQNLICCSRHLNGTGYEYGQGQSIEPSEGLPHLMHVNGDILAGLIASGPNSLHEVMETQPTIRKDEKDCAEMDTSTVRYARLTTLVNELLYDGGESTRDPVGDSMAYLRKVLQPLL